MSTILFFLYDKENQLFVANFHIKISKIFFYFYFNIRFLFFISGKTCNMRGMNGYIERIYKIYYYINKKKKGQTINILWRDINLP